MLRPLLFLAIAASSTASLALDTLDEVRTCIEGNIPQRTVVQDLAIVHSDRIGKQRRLIGRLFVRRNDRGLLETVMRFQEPEDLRNAAYLLLEGSGQIQDKLLGRYDDRVYVYLPAAGSARKVDAGAAAGQLFGTNLNYTDIKHLFGSVADGKVRKLDDEMVAGRRTYTLEIVPRENTSPYARVVAHVDALTCLVLQSSFHGRNGKLAKRMRLNPEKISREDGRFVGHEYRLEEMHSPEHTMLYIGNVHYDEGLNETFFHPDGFHLAR